MVVHCSNAFSLFSPAYTAVMNRQNYETPVIPQKFRLNLIIEEGTLAPVGSRCILNQHLTLSQNPHPLAIYQ